MRRLLIISPHFPPADVVDMHRVRMNARYYRDNGWDPVVLAVKPEAAGRLVDQRLCALAPPDVRVVRTGALPRAITRPFGLTALGLRAYFQLGAAGDRLCAELKPELVFFSTTAFPVLALGARWKARFGVPFVADLQDPWFTAPASSLAFRRTDPKAKLMNAINRTLERRTMNAVDGLIAVSGDYYPPLIETFPRLADIPRAVIPFGNEPADLEAARDLGEPKLGAIGGKVGLYAGRVGPDMTTALDALFAVLRAGAAPDLKILFQGTSYQRGDTRKVVEPQAARVGVTDRIVEAPDRLSLLDALRALTEADLLVILGSDDLAYQPSKLFQYLSTDRPVLCVAPAGSRIEAVVSGLDSVFLLAPDEAPATAAARLNAWLAPRLGRAVKPSPARREVVETYSARRLAAAECALFDQVAGP